MNAIEMIRRCGRYGTAEGWAECGPPESIPTSTTVYPEEPMGNGETGNEEPVRA